jgi:hypothetical protein
MATLTDGRFLAKTGAAAENVPNQPLAWGNQKRRTPGGPS